MLPISTHNALMQRLSFLPFSFFITLIFSGCNNPGGSSGPPPVATTNGSADNHTRFYIREFEEEAGRILDFWMTRTPDAQNGGFYGAVDANGQAIPRADKAGILNTRILWTFSAAGREMGDPKYREIARQAHTYLDEHFLDPDYGGLYWMLNFRGKPVEMRKQVYAQAFAIYAFSEYYRLSETPKALDNAVSIYRLLEKHAHDPVHGGYYDSFSREWKRMEETMLGPDDIKPAKTMNTHLHVLEAYTNLYRVWKDEELRERLRELILLHLDKIMDQETAHLDLFFAADWTMKGEKIISYGHDIEASWLLTEAAEVLGDEALLDRVKKVAVRMAAVTLEEGFDPDGGLLYEATPEELTNTNKSWWPQAEAMVGFFNAYQLSGDKKYREAAEKSWAFIQKFLIDRENGEWRSAVTREGEIIGTPNLGSAWKAPYHNTRSCLEMRRRVEEHGN